MKRVDKQAVPVVLENDEPLAIIFYNKNRDRIIYMLSKAGEDEIINLIEDKKEDEDSNNR